MKKNFAMRIAACLLVVTMLSLCMVSYTYAKYTTNNTYTEEARVAKWGVVVTAAAVDDVDDIFAKEYKSSDSDVVVSATSKVVAPGTSGTATILTVSGAPEVATSVNATGVLTLSDDWEVGTDFYCPIKFTITSTSGTHVVNGLDHTSAAAFKAAVEAAIANSLDKEYAPNTTLNDSVIVSWEWPFEVTGNDAKDTALGNLTPAPTIKLEVTVQVDQINDLA